MPAEPPPADSGIASLIPSLVAESIQRRSSNGAPFLTPCVEQIAAAVVCVQLTGFDDLASALGPRGDMATLATIVQGATKIVVELIWSGGGEVVRFVGDVALCVFYCETGEELGAATARALAASAAALRTINRWMPEQSVVMAAATALLASGFESTGQLVTARASVGCGADTTLAHLGNEERREHVFTGHAVRQALVALAASCSETISPLCPDGRMPGQIVASAEAQAACKGVHVFASDGFTEHTFSADGVLGEAEVGLDALPSEKAAERLAKIAAVEPALLQPYVARMQWCGALEEEAEQRNLSVVSVSVRPRLDFSGPWLLNEHGVPEDGERLATLSECYLRMSGAAMKFGGFVRLFMIDERGIFFVAVFGLVRKSPDDVRAVRCGMEIRKVLGNITELDADINVGVQRGQCVKCRVGHDDRSELSIIGRRVSYSHSLMQNVSKDFVAVSQEAHDGTEALIEYSAAGKYHVEGIRDALQCYKAERVILSESAQEACVGREDEARHIDEVMLNQQRRHSDLPETFRLWQRESSDSLQVEGVAGVGKSTFVRAAIERHKERQQSTAKGGTAGMRIACVACKHAESTSSFFAARQILHWLIKTTEQTTVAQLSKTISQFVLRLRKQQAELQEKQEVQRSLKRDQQLQYVLNESHVADLPLLAEAGFRVRAETLRAYMSEFQADALRAHEEKSRALAVEAAKSGNARLKELSERKLPTAIELLGDDDLDEMTDVSKSKIVEAWLVQVLCSVASLSAPVCFIVEDAQWIDHESWGVLNLLSKARVATVIITCRPAAELSGAAAEEEEEHLGTLANASVVRLEPWDEKTAQILIKAQLHVAVGQQFRRLVDEIWNAAHGLPLHMHELLLQIEATEGAIEEHDGIMTNCDFERLALSDSVAGAIRTRLDQLEAADNELLQECSCYGDSFSSLVIARVTGRQIMGLLDAFARLQGAGFVQERTQESVESDDFNFCHPRIRAAVGGMIPEAAAVEMHRKIADRYEGMVAADWALMHPRSGEAKAESKPPGDPAEEAEEEAEEEEELDESITSNDEARSPEPVAPSAPSPAPEEEPQDDAGAEPVEATDDKVQRLREAREEAGEAAAADAGPDADAAGAEGPAEGAEGDAADAAAPDGPAAIERGELGAHGVAAAHVVPHPPEGPARERVGGFRMRMRTSAWMPPEESSASAQKPVLVPLGDGGAMRIGELAQHLLAAGEPLRALKWLEAAADVTYSLGMWRTSNRLFTQLTSIVAAEGRRLGVEKWRVAQWWAAISIGETRVMNFVAAHEHADMALRTLHKRSHGSPKRPKVSIFRERLCLTAGLCWFAPGDSFGRKRISRSDTPELASEVWGPNLEAEMRCLVAVVAAAAGGGAIYSEAQAYAYFWAQVRIARLSTVIPDDKPYQPYALTTRALVKTFSVWGAKKKPALLLERAAAVRATMPEKLLLPRALELDDQCLTAEITALSRRGATADNGRAAWELLGQRCCEVAQLRLAEGGLGAAAHCVVAARAEEMFADRPSVHLQTALGERPCEERVRSLLEPFGASCAEDVIAMDADVLLPLQKACLIFAGPKGLLDLFYGQEWLSEAMGEFGSDNHERCKALLDAFGEVSAELGVTAAHEDDAPSSPDLPMSCMYACRALYHAVQRHPRPALDAIRLNSALKDQLLLPFAHGLEVEAGLHLLESGQVREEADVKYLLLYLGRRCLTSYSGLMYQNLPSFLAQRARLHWLLGKADKARRGMRKAKEAASEMGFERTKWDCKLYLAAMESAKKEEKVLRDIAAAGYGASALGSVLYHKLSETKGLNAIALKAADKAADAAATAKRAKEARKSGGSGGGGGGHSSSSSSSSAHHRSKSHKSSSSHPGESKEQRRERRASVKALKLEQEGGALPGAVAGP